MNEIIKEKNYSVVKSNFLLQVILPRICAYIAL